MKKLLFISAVIILVCLNWFDKSSAQDISNMSVEEKKALMAKFSETGRPVEAEPAYQSADIYGYDSSELIGLPLEDPKESDQPLPKSLPPRTGQQLEAFEDLQPFGTELFSGPRETTPPNDLAAADDYQLGPGDHLIVTVWGQAEKEYQLTVDREGKLFVPQLGELVAWGHSLGEFRNLLNSRFATIYSDFNMSVSLGKIRSIRIYLTGEVNRPGAYTVSSLTSLFNALYLAGGPNEHGSMRDIRLMRRGEVAARIDLYKFLLEGDNSSDVRLETGDAIFIPVAGPRAAVRGKIRRAAIYELTGEQSALDLLTLAGGPDADAYLGRVMLERVTGDDWKVLDLCLNANQPDSVVNAVMADGDRVTVYSVFEMKKNMVAAFGLVRHPGYYERAESGHVSDLLERAKLQPYDVHFKRANLFRRHDDWRREVIPVDLGKIMTGAVEYDLALQDGDSLHVYAMSDVAWDQQVYIEGKVKNPGQYEYYDRMTIDDLIFLAGSFNRGASMMRAEIARVDSLGDVTLIDVNLRDDHQRRTELRENDRIYIRQLPNWRLHRTVKIDGEVMYPGEYVLAGGNETLYELLRRAGGLTDIAFPRGTIFERPSVGLTLERKQIGSMLRRSSPVVQDSLGNLTRRTLFEYEPDAMNRIVLDVEGLLSSRGGCCDIILEPGDKIFIPPVPSGISVLGAVGSSGTIKYQEEKNARYFVKRAGNFTSEADKGGLRLIRANGEVYSGNGTSGKTVELGDIIVVPTKIRKQKNYTKTLTTALSAVTGVLTTILLVDRL